MKLTDDKKASVVRRKGFTLIELLVVIAIIAILAAILFPVFARARENARRAACQSNLKQIGLGFLQYAQDYDEMLPVGEWDTATGASPSVVWAGRGNGWAGRISPYMKSAQIFKCPSHMDPGRPLGSVSYAYNGALVTRPDWGPFGGFPKLAVFNATAKTILLVEVRRTGTANPTVAGETFSPYANGTNPWPNIGPFGAGYNPNYQTGAFSSSPTGGGVGDVNSYGRHLEGSNFAFLDGHVKWMRASKVSPGWAARNPDAAGNTDPNSAAGTNVEEHAATFSPI